MKITAIETIPVRLPVGKFLDGTDKVRGNDAAGRYQAGRIEKSEQPGNTNGLTLLSNVIVKIHTDEGITGVGEAACDQAEPVQVIKAMIDHHMAPQLIGENPMNWKYLISLVTWDAARGATRFSTSGIDLALHDLVAKVLGVPVYTLLGGCQRTKLLAGIEVPRGTPEQMAQHSYEYFQEGVRAIKAKIGSDPWRDVECLQAIRDKLGPDISLRADANCAYTYNEAKIFCKLTEASGTGLELLEQPLAIHDLDGLRELRNSTTIPIEVDESAYSLSILHLILKNNSADIINTKCAKAGGIKGVAEWAAAAAAAQKPIVIGTEWGVGLKVAAKLHLGASIPNADPVVEFTEIMIHELLLKTPLQLLDGYLTVPTMPGLGLELDDEKVEAYRSCD